MIRIHRDVTPCAETTWDLIVVGGGIYGVCHALEAARRGLRPLLVERGDFGGAATWNHLRIVHGGLRYLQSLDLRRVRESVEERTWFLRHFPALVRPLECLMPLYGGWSRHPLTLRLALTANELLTRHRNRGVEPTHQIRPGRLAAPEEVRDLFPDVDPVGLRGGAVWHDALMTDGPRLTIELLRWACSLGAAALNHVEVRALLTSGSRVEGVEAVDHESGDRVELRAPVVLNCAGPWCATLAARLDAPRPELFPPSIACNLLLDREPLSTAALAVGDGRRGGQTFFLVPYHGKVLAGTLHATWNGEADGARMSEARIERFLASLGECVPALRPEPDAVLSVQAALLPATGPGSSVQAHHPIRHDHGRHGGPRGLISVSGVKATTARRVAEETILRTFAPGRLADPASDPPEPRSFDPSAVVRALLQDPESVGDLVRSIVEEESVVHVDDLLLRRSEWDGIPPHARDLAPSVCRLLGWDGERTREELERLERALEPHRLVAPESPVGAQASEGR